MFKKQSTRFTCGVSALKNCFTIFGKRISENKIRETAGTTHEGTTGDGIIATIKKVGYEYREIRNTHPIPFLVSIKQALKKGYVLILLTDHEQHWVSVIAYENRHFSIIDPEKGQKLQKSLTGKELTAWANNFSKNKKIQYFYAIGLRP